MKKLLIGLCLATSLPTMAQVVNLACQGQTISNNRVDKFPQLNLKNEKGWMMVNIVIDLNDKSMIIGDSYYTANLKYKNLSISDSHYSINHFWPKPNNEYAYYSTSMYIDRFTGNYEFSSSSLTKDGGIKNEHTSKGTCQIGSQWQPKF